MCVPIAIALAAASVAMSAAGAMASYSGAQQQAKAQSNFNLQQANNNNAATVNNYAQAQQQLVYRNDEASQQMTENLRAARAAKATALTSAGEAGISGNSVGDLSRSYDQRASEFNSDVLYNRDAADSEIALQMKGMQAQGQSENNQLRPPVYPSFLTPALQIGSDSLRAYNTYLKPPPSAANTNPYSSN